jgi:hypothetical protein
VGVGGLGGGAIECVWRLTMCLCPLCLGGRWGWGGGGGAGWVGGWIEFL